jgi:hypothetical protein
MKNMLKILFKDGIEKECEGRVKFYLGIQPALCSYDFIIEGKNNPDKDNIKLVYDTETKESILFNFCSYRFTNDNKEPYETLYKQAIRDIALAEQFRDCAYPFIEHGDLTANIDDLVEWMVFEQEKISNILILN